VQVGAAGEIDDRARQRLVEREVEAARARDPLAIAQRLVDGAPQGDTGVLDRVVLVDVQVPWQRICASSAPCFASVSSM